MPPRVPSFSRSSSLYEDIPLTCERDNPHDSTSPDPRLGIVLDLDGTLIAENDDPDIMNEGFIRPGAVEFMSWCLARGHSLALWTAAHPSWAHYVAWKLCTALDADHSCSGGDCRQSFDFVWSAEKLRTRKRIPVSAHGKVDGCLWCGEYQQHCDRCECHGSTDPSRSSSIFSCPCRSTKDLRKVWRKQKKNMSPFRPERTILVENTPQQCIQNYGNAVYVTTYDGNAEKEARDPIFHRMKTLILRMEQSPDVRLVERCRHGTAPHACFEQNWWRSGTLCRPCCGSPPEQQTELGDRLRVPVDV